MYYTFRFVAEYPWHKAKVFECSKWGDYKEPIDVYRVIVKPRSASCNCYARGNCIHIDCVKEIIANNFEGQMHHYIWDRQNTWSHNTDLEYA